MNLNTLSIGQLITIFAYLTRAPARTVLDAHPKLAAWTEDLQADHDRLLSANQAPPDRPAAAPGPDLPDGRTLDRRAEAAIRALLLAYRLNAELATAQDDPERAQRWASAEARVFDQGMSFINSSYQTQTGATDRLIAQAESADLRDLTATLSVQGLDQPALLALIRAHNEALRAHDQRPSDPTSPAPSLPKVRRGALVTLRRFLSVVDQVFPPRDPNPQRDTLLAELRRAFA